MRTAKLLLAALVVAAIAAAMIAMSMPASVGQQQDSRSVIPLAIAEEPSKFDPSQSAALFVGVREFDGAVSPVQYAVDDAVDLAYAFSLGGKSGLVEPERVVLALSGEPHKKESKARLEQLRESGVVISSATAQKIRSLLREQAARVTSQGILIASFATHGFLGDDGTHFLLGETSFDAATSLSATEVLDVASRARRSLVLVDACRERVPSGSRAGDKGPDSTAPFITRMTPLRGQVVLYAAPPGGYAFDNDGNGVFTKAVLEGLACKGTKARVLDAETLHRYVDDRVRKWVEKERPGYPGGVQINVEGRTRLMPLANCRCDTPAPPSDIWRASVAAPVSHFEVADIDNDCQSDVVVNAGGKLHVFGANGTLRWSGGEAVREFVVGEPYRYQREVLAVSDDRFWVFDSDGNALSTVLGRFRDVEFYRPTKLFSNRVMAYQGDIALLFGSKESEAQWRRKLSGVIRSVGFEDRNDDGRLDLVYRTSTGEAVLDVTGRPLNGAKTEKLPRK